MIYKNAELNNVSELLPLEDGGVTWRRVPAWVEEEMQPGGVGMNRAATGVEIRFVLEGEEAVLRMAALPESYGDGTAMFHVFRGGTRAARWRAIIAESVADACLPNLTYINGLDLLGSAALLSADEVHPNLYGVATIADRLGEQIRRRIDG